MHLDDAVRHGETETGALAHLLGGEERAEELVEVFLGDAGAVVGDHDDDVLLGAVQRDEDAAAVGQRVLGVGQQVGEHLHDLVGVELGHRVGEAVVDGDRDALVDGDGAQHLLDEGGQVGGLPHDAALAGEVEQPGDDPLAAVRLIDDQADVFGHGGVVLAVFEQQVGVQQQDPQGVVDLVRDAGGELAHAGELLALDQGLLGRLQGAVGLLQFVDRPAQLLDRVRQAHLDLGQALPDRHRVIATALVAAGAAVELVLGRRLVHARQDLAQLLRRRHVVEALVERREGPREVDAGELVDRGLPGRAVERPLAGAGLAAHVGAALEHRLFAAEAGAHDAALAAEDVEQARLGLAVLELADGVGQVGAPVGGHDVAAEQILVELGGLQHAARDGEQGAEAAVRWIEVVVGGRQRGQSDAPGLQHGAQLDVGERGVDLALELLVQRLALLGDAGTDEDDLHVGPVLGVEHAGDGEHRRDDGGEVVEQIGVVLARVAHDGRAGGGHVAAVGRGEQSRVFGGHQVGAEADLVDVGEAEGAQGRDQRRSVALGELRRVAGGDDRRHRRGAGENALGVLDAAEDLLGVLAAHRDAVAAADAARLDDARLAVEDLDGFGGALAHARVARAALLADGRDELLSGATRSSFMGGPEGAVASATAREELLDLGQQRLGVDGLVEVGVDVHLGEVGVCLGAEVEAQLAAHRGGDDDRHAGGARVGL